MQQSARHLQRRLAMIALGAIVVGCGDGTSSPGGGAGATAGPSGVTGATGGTGGAAATTGVSGTTLVTTGEAGAAGTAGASGATSGAAGTGGASIDATTGGPDAGAPIRDGGDETGAGGTRDAGAIAPDAAGSNKVLIYGVTTGFRHTSIPAAANAITRAAAAVGLTTEQVGCTDATNKPDPTKFTAAALAQYGAVILLANSGEPMGYPATQEIQNLVDYVQHGGALVGIEDASHCYDGTFSGHPASQPFVQLIGGDFISHPGDVSPAMCTKVGTQASVVLLPATFRTTDEVYAFSQFRMDNQVVLRCMSSADPTQTVRPVSWVREEGMGRYFFTALGHLDASWTAPLDAQPTSRLVEGHVIPGLLWTMRR